MKNVEHPAATAALFWSQMGVNARWRQHLSRMVTALGAGGSAIPFGDNGDVFRALAETREQERGRTASC